MLRLLLVMLLYCACTQCFSKPSPVKSAGIKTVLLSDSFVPDNETESEQADHHNLVSLNRNLKIAFYATLSALLLLALMVFYWRRRALRSGKLRLRENEGVLNDIAPILNDTNSEVGLLRAALNEERAKVVRHEVQKKELLAYIEEIKSMQGNTEVRHKTIQIQRIFAEQKTEDIVNKVENTAKLLYPEFVETVQKHYPELNKLELQYCMMLTLGYNLDEVMSVLGRSEKAIKSLRYRIRKKMNLDDSQSLKSFIQEMRVYITENQETANSEAFSSP